MVRKDGSRFTVEGVISPIRDAEGAFSHVVVILRDITEIQAIERRLRESLEELRRTDASRRATLAQIVEGQEQELDRMAEGIEDSSLQQMTAVRIRLETLRRNLSDPAQLGALEKLEGSVEEAVGQLRGLVSELRPRELATEGLGGAIREHLRHTAGLRTEVVGSLGEDPDQQQAATAFRVVQETVASALEDRAAARLTVELEDADDGFTVRIVDDGASWTTVGPSTMRDRAGLAGGRCLLFDGQGGATVELWLPLRAPATGEQTLRRP
jgi:two-component system sensor histidine kinase UhpB